MNAASIVEELRPLGSSNYARILKNHGVCDPVLGVKIAELKKYQKRIRKDYQLSLDLYDTGIYDAQYLAGLIADERKMTQRDLKRWLKQANCMTLCGTVVAWIAAESPFGWKLSLEWIDSTDESTAQTGWHTLSCLVGIADDSTLDIAALRQLLLRVQRTIHQQPNAVRYAMNNFVIAVGAGVRELTQAAREAARTIGKVTVDMGNTDCKVPDAGEYLAKSERLNRIGKKRKSARC